jgi:acyl carrier protein
MANPSADPVKAVMWRSAARRAACIMPPGIILRASRRPMSDKVAPLRQPAIPADPDTLTGEVAGLIVEALNLDIAPADIDPDQPLYGEGLGLDSIDILEIALVVSKQYGVQLRADSEENQRIFGSLRQLVDYIIAHRTK